MAKLIRLEDNPRTIDVRSRKRRGRTMQQKKTGAKILKFPVFYPRVEEELICGLPDELKNQEGLLMPTVAPYGES
ncbi:MAG: hypothetical protein R6U40_12820 [Desulfobacterales bacterium]